MASLDDAFHKLDRGKEHIAQLWTGIKRTLDNDRFEQEITSKPYPKPSRIKDARPWEAFTLVCSHVPVIDKKDEILLGEALQSFRSSLDYLAWAWVTESVSKRATTLTPQQEQQVMFPMARSPKSFRDQVDQRLPKVSAKRRAFIRHYQPYRHSDAGSALRWLNVLSNIEKHRIIVPALMSPQAGDISFSINSSLECVKQLHHVSTKREIEVGTKIMTMVLAGSAPQNERRIHVDTKLTLMPMLPRSIVGLTASKDVVLLEHALNLIIAVCTEILKRAKNEF